MGGRVWPRHWHCGRPLNWVVRRHAWVSHLRVRKQRSRCGTIDLLKPEWEFANLLQSLHKHFTEENRHDRHSLPFACEA